MAIGRLQLTGRIGRGAVKRANAMYAQQERVQNALKAADFGWHFSTEETIRRVKALLEQHQVDIPKVEEELGRPLSSERGAIYLDDLLDASWNAVIREYFG